MAYTADTEEDPALRITTVPNTLISSTTEPNEAAVLDSESDLDAPDYRLLNQTSKSHKLPPRGVKDFEENATQRQASALEESRRAMYDTLRVTRVHNVKTGMVGQFFCDSGEWDGTGFDMRHELEENRARDHNRASQRKGDTKKQREEGRCVVVKTFTSTYSKTMGRTDRRNWTWLLPEEALFLLERGSLDIRWPPEDEDEDDESLSDDEDREEQTLRPGEELLIPVEQVSTRMPSATTRPKPARLRFGKLPMSLQGAYATLIGKSDLTLERYLVYANLKRNGYVVQRAPTWHGPIEIDTQSKPILPFTTSPDEERYPLSAINTPNALVYRSLAWLYSFFVTAPQPGRTECYSTSSGPLISPGLFRSYYDVFRQLRLIPSHTYSSSPLDHTFRTTQTKSSPATTEPLLLPTFQVHKPSVLQTYRKSAPPPPDFTIVVIDTHDPSTSSIPTSSQIGTLLDSFHDNELPVYREPTKKPASSGEKSGMKTGSMANVTLTKSQRTRLEQRIKHGQRHVHFAIVDSGIISYMRFSGGGFATGKQNCLWEENEVRDEERKRNGGGRSGVRGGGSGGKGGGQRGRRGKGGKR